MQTAISICFLRVVATLFSFCIRLAVVGCRGTTNLSIIAFIRSSTLFTHACLCFRFYFYILANMSVALLDCVFIWLICSFRVHIFRSRLIYFLCILRLFCFNVSLDVWRYNTMHAVVHLYWVHKFQVKFSWKSRMSFIHILTPTIMKWNNLSRDHSKWLPRQWIVGHFFIISFRQHTTLLVFSPHVRITCFAYSFDRNEYFWIWNYFLRKVAIYLFIDRIHIDIIIYRCRSLLFAISMAALCRVVIVFVQFMEIPIDSCFRFIIVWTKSHLYFDRMNFNSILRARNK